MGPCACPHTCRGLADPSTNVPERIPGPALSPSKVSTRHQRRGRGRAACSSEPRAGSCLPSRPKQTRVQKEATTAQVPEARPPPPEDALPAPALRGLGLTTRAVPCQDSGRRPWGGGLLHEMPSERREGGGVPVRPRWVECRLRVPLPAGNPGRTAALWVPRAASVLRRLTTAGSHSAARALLAPSPASCPGRLPDALTLFLILKRPRLPQPPPSCAHLWNLPWCSLLSHWSAPGHRSSDVPHREALVTCRDEGGLHGHFLDPPPPLVILAALPGEAEACLESVPLVLKPGPGSCPLLIRSSRPLHRAMRLHRSLQWSR